MLPQISSAQPNNSARRIYPMNRDWLFGGRKSADATAVDFDDSRFARVTLPHTNVILPWHSFDERDYEFVSIYRRHFRVPASAKGQRVFVDFEGAMTASTVAINGHKFPEFRGGYTPFSFDLTPHLNWNGDNVLLLNLILRNGPIFRRSAAISTTSPSAEFIARSLCGLYRTITSRTFLPSR